MVHCQNYTERRKWKYSGRALSQCKFVNHKSHMDLSGINTKITNLLMSCSYNFCDRLIYKHLIIHRHIYFHSCGGVRLSTLVPYLLLSLWSIPLLPLQSTSKMYGIMVEGDNHKYSEKTWPSAILFTSNHKQMDLESNQGIRHEKPAIASYNEQ